MPFEFIPENIDFEVGYETTKMPAKKYVVNKNHIVSSLIK